MAETITIELTREQASDLATDFEFFLLQKIREDEEIDNLLWVENQIKTWRQILDKLGEDDG